MSILLYVWLEYILHSIIIVIIVICHSPFFQTYIRNLNALACWVAGWQHACAQHARACASCVQYAKYEVLEVEPISCSIQACYYLQLVSPRSNLNQVSSFNQVVSFSRDQVQTSK